MICTRRSIFWGWSVGIIRFLRLRKIRWMGPDVVLWNGPAGRSQVGCLSVNAMQDLGSGR